MSAAVVEALTLDLLEWLAAGENLIWLRLKNEIQRLCFAACDRYLLRLLAVRLMPGGNRVVAWRKVGKFEIALAACH
jgi:hypothetical protein